MKPKGETKQTLWPVIELSGAWDGYRIDQHGVLWAPDTWRQGFTVGQFRAMFFECQLVRSLKTDVRLLRLEIERLNDLVNLAEKRAAFYREQCHLEAKLGMALLPLHRP